MVNPNMAGEDASMDSAVAAIAAKLGAPDAEKRQDDTRENREDRDITEAQTSTDLEESERAEAERRAAEEGGEGEQEAEAGEGAEAEADQYLELPPAEEGAEPERVPLTEAVEAVKQLRQLQGDIQTAVIKAEEEAYSKQDQITQALNKTFSDVRLHAQTALELMYQYMPQQPDPIMLDENSGYYNPAAYHKQKLYYDAYAENFHKVQATLKQAEAGSNVTLSHQDQEFIRRETERTARFIPEWKDDKAREALKGEMLETLGKRYGITKADLDDIADHKALRIVYDLHKSLKTSKAAPEVRKSIQETKPRIVNNRTQQAREKATGKFVSADRKELKETGTEGAFAKMLLKSGALKDLL